jgi:hypothetical protein
MPGMSLGHAVVLKCSYCQGTIGEHEESCPQEITDQLRFLQRTMPCPKCKKGTVDRNADDFFECRSCHRQFTTADRDDSWEKLILFDDFHDEYFHVALMPNKGKGGFPLDRQIKEVKWRRVRRKT